MKAIDRFRNFFRAEGVEMYEWNSTSRDHLGDKVITVSQAHFYFKDGEYVGVKDDETGHFMLKL